MDIFVVVLVFSSVIFLALFGGLIWMIKTGQLDDTKTPAERMLWDDTPEKRPNES